jgi:hypothetical protein
LLTFILSDLKHLPRLQRQARGCRTETEEDVASASWHKACSFSNGKPDVPLITGVGLSHLDHDLGPGRATRLYLLKAPTGALAIEVVDAHDAGHLNKYSKIVQNLHFKP